MLLHEKEREMCVKRDDFSVKKRVFAHAFLFPKGFRKYSVRIQSLVAVSDGGKEIRRSADQTRYKESESEEKAAFIPFAGSAAKTAEINRAGAPSVFLPPAKHFARPKIGKEG